MSLERMNDKDFMEYLDKGSRGIYDLEIGTKVTTEKILNVSTSGISVVDGFLRITTPMIESAKKNEVLEITEIDRHDGTYCLSNGLWYIEDFLTIFK